MSRKIVKGKSRIVAGVWTCSSCKTPEIDGSLTSCPHCGNPRDSDEKPRLGANSRQVTDQREIDRARSGPNKRCGSCGTENKASNTTCSQCGSLLDTFVSDQNYATSHGSTHRDDRGGNGQKHADAGTSGQSSYVGSPERYQSNNYSRAFSQVRQFNLGSISWPVWGALGGLILVLAILLWPHKEMVTVRGFAWERTAHVYLQKWVEEEAWEGEVPNGATILSSRDAQRTTEQVEVGRIFVDPPEVCTDHEDTVDLGNGYYEINSYQDCTDPSGYYEIEYEDKPIYATKYTYKIQRWVFEKTLTSTGTDKSPYWPQASFGRVNNASEKYQVELMNSREKEFVTNVNYDNWMSYRLDQRWYAWMNLFGGVYSLSPIE